MISFSTEELPVSFFFEQRPFTFGMNEQNRMAAWNRDNVIIHEADTEVCRGLVSDNSFLIARRSWIYVDRRPAHALLTSSDVPY